LDVNPALEYGFKEAINAFLAGLGDAAPAGSLAEIIAFNKKDLANRAPYGQDHLEASQNTKITAEQYAALEQHSQASARNGIDRLLDQFDIDVIVSDVNQTYAPAGYPALTVPAGYAEDGTPKGVVFVGGYLSEPQLLAVGRGYEQAAQARVAPNLEATMKLIETAGKASK
jgi:amidase